MSREGQQRAEEALVRRCVHSRRGAAGTYYGGAQYLAALQRQRASVAVEAARKVEPLYWQDAPKIKVLLCADCAQGLGL